MALIPAITLSEPLKGTALADPGAAIERFVDTESGAIFRRGSEGRSLKPDGSITPEQLAAVKAHQGKEAGGGNGGPPSLTESPEFKEAMNLQLEALRRQNDFAASLFPHLKEFFVTQSKVQTEALGLLRKSFEGTPAQQRIRELSEQETIRILEGKPRPLSEQEERLLTDIEAGSRRRGQVAIRQFGEELAPSRGLRITDTPIGGELLRQERELETTLGEAGQRARLDFTTGREAFTESVARFQQTLGEQARLNRLSLGLGGNPPALPASNVTDLFQLGLTERGQNITESLGRANIAAERERTNAALLSNLLASTSKRQKTSGFDIFSAAAGPLAMLLGTSLSGGTAGTSLLGGIIGGIRSLFGSTVRIKRDLQPLDAHDAALETLTAMPLFRYRYRWERDEDRAPHIGPLLEMSPPEIREDAWRINLGDYAGLTHAAVKALDRKVDRLSHALATRIR